MGRASSSTKPREGSIANIVMRVSGLAVGNVGTKSFFQEADPETPGTLTTSGAILGIISTILGGGMVGLPWAIYSQGFILGIVICAFTST